MSSLKQLIRNSLAFKETLSFEQLHQMAELGNEIDLHFEAGIALESASVTLSKIKVSLESSIKTGSFTEQEYRYCNIAIDDVYNQLGLTNNKISLEAWGESSTAVAVVTLEGVTDTLKKVASKSYEIIKKLVAKFKEYFKKLFNKVEMRKAKTEHLASKNKAYVSTIKQKIKEDGSYTLKNGTTLHNESALRQTIKVPSDYNPRVAAAMSFQVGVGEWHIEKGLENLYVSFNSFKQFIPAIVNDLKNLMNYRYDLVDIEKLKNIQNGKYLAGGYIEIDTESHDFPVLDSALPASREINNPSDYYFYPSIGEDMMERLYDIVGETYGDTLELCEHVNALGDIRENTFKEFEEDSIRGLFYVFFASARFLAVALDEISDTPARLLWILRGFLDPQAADEAAGHFQAGGMGHANSVERMFGRDNVA